LIGGLATPALAAPAYDRLPADDPDTLAAWRAAGVAGSPLPGKAAPVAAAPAARPAPSFGSASSLLHAAASGIRAVAAAAGEGLYEAAYMFGANPTPM